GAVAKFAWRPVEKVRAGTDVVAEPSIEIDIGKPDNFVADHRERRVIVEIEHGLQQAVGCVAGGRYETRERIHILTCAWPELWQHVPPILRSGAEHRGG